MPIEQTQRHCKSCGRQTLHQRQAPNHLIHAIVTLFLCGLWIPVWILVSIFRGSYRCQISGKTN